MEYKVYQKELELQSRGWIPTFHDVTKEVCEIVQASGMSKRHLLRSFAPHHLLCDDSRMLA